jgi:hypothetical protein
MDRPITRRQFLFSMGYGALAFAGMGGREEPAASRPYFQWAQLRYSGAWDPNPNGPSRFMAEFRKRTSVEAGVRKIEVEAGDESVFTLPFLCVSGRGDFPDPGEQAALWLRRYVEHGGFVLFDDATGIENSGFARGVEKWLERAFPGEVLKPLPADHTVYQSFYLLSGAPGRKIVRPVLTGLERENLTPVIFTHNDLAGAWDGDPLGGYANPCIPGGERQRELSIRLGVNLALYALTGNYKKDQVHIPFILKRRKR